MKTYYQARRIEQWIEQLYRAYGYSEEDSELIAQSLISADLYGIESHGVQRIKMYDRKIQAGDIVIDANPQVVWETPVSAVIDGRKGMGQLVAIRSMKLAIEKAAKAGIGLVTVRNSNHYGRAGYYSQMASQKGLIGISATNSNPLLVPTHAVQVFLGSNPLAFSMPAKPHDFLFDAATTTVSFGKIEILDKQGKTLPGAWAVDENNEINFDAGQILKNLKRFPRLGGILPIGGKGENNSGYKGYGLALIIEILTSILSQGNLSADMGGGKVKGISHFFAAIDLHLFGQPEDLNQRLSEMLERIRQLPHESGEKIYVSGDKESEAYQQRMKNGIRLDPQTVNEISLVSERLHVPYQKYLS
ncbi:MAG: Ldh family oxidoreductase [Sporolactobacillus sp.]